jgi:hypothetical protein
MDLILSASADVAGEPVPRSRPLSSIADGAFSSSGAQLDLFASTNPVRRIRHPVDAHGRA